MKRSSDVIIHNAREIEGIRVAARRTAEVREALRDYVRPGMSTFELDRFAGQTIEQLGGKSAFLGYHGFPGQVCVSLNEEVVHGIGRPERIIQPGDVVSVDVGVSVGGFIGDTALSVIAGWAPEQTGVAKSLLDTTWSALAAGIDAARGGSYVNDISRAVEKVVTAAGLFVVKDFVGHGCGCQLHEPPEVPNFAQSARGPRLSPGMVLAIEPMVNLGTHRVLVDQDDGWTVRTQDGQLSAHFEHMVLITEGKPEILTWPKMLSR